MNLFYHHEESWHKMFIRNFYEDVLIKILRWIRSDHQQVRSNKRLPLSQFACLCALSKSEIYILNGWIEFTYSFVPIMTN